jgi:hypothetical protein
MRDLNITCRSTTMVHQTDIKRPRHGTCSWRLPDQQACRSNIPMQKAADHDRVIVFMTQGLRRLQVLSRTVQTVHCTVYTFHFLKSNQSPYAASVTQRKYDPRARHADPAKNRRCSRANMVHQRLQKSWFYSRPMSNHLGPSLDVRARFHLVYAALTLRYDFPTTPK